MVIWANFAHTEVALGADRADGAVRFHDVMRRLVQMMQMASIAGELVDVPGWPRAREQ